MDKIRVGVIGFGRMGDFYLKKLTASDLWDVAYICDISEEARAEATEAYPGIAVVEDEDVIFNDPTVDVVGLFALCNTRLRQIRKAVATGKHILSEKPVADSLEREWEAVSLVEGSNVISAVNLYLRNSWYHNAMKEFIQSGEIGELAILRICHMTPGLAPGEGHMFEGPSFHDCGMHYVDILRWYAESEYKTWQAQGMRMWNYKDPWWLSCHGTFENGIVFDVTQGFVYGQLSKDQTHNSYADIIGTKGVVRMTHDFVTATVDFRGVTRTERITKPYGGKNISVLCDKFAQSVLSGQRDPTLPTFRDSAIASQTAWTFIDDARSKDLPAIGNEETLVQIRDRRSKMTNGYGLLHIRKH